VLFRSRHRIEHNQFRDSARNIFLNYQDWNLDIILQKTLEIEAREFHLKTGLDKMLAHIDALTAESVTRTRENENSAIFLMTVLTAGSFSIGIVLVIWLTRRISRSLARAGTLAMRIADGDHIEEFPQMRDKETQRLVGAMEDMHRSIRWAEAGIADAAERAEAADRMKSEFLANMSHEIRTPISAIIGYSEILDSHGCSVQMIREGVSVIKRNGQHLLTLINDILDLSKLEAGHFEMESREFTLHHLLQDIYTLFAARTAEKKLDFTIDLVGPCPSLIVTDETRLRQILINLVGNADRKSVV